MTSFDQNSIIIGDFSYQNIFLDLKKNNPHSALKFLTKEEVGSLLEFEIKPELIKYLILEKGLDYVKAKQLAKLLIFANEEKLELKKELLNKNIISKNIYGEYFFQNKKIYLFEVFEDNELISLLIRHNIQFEFLKIEDFIKEKEFKEKIYLFKDYTEEYHYIFSSINKLLLKDNVLPKDIYFYSSNILPFHIEQFENLYEIKTNLVKSKTLISLPIIFETVSIFYKNKQINLDFNQKEVSLKKLANIIEDYKLLTLPFAKAYLILLEILSNTLIKEYSKNDGINIIDRPIFKDNIYLFITNFESGTFYKIYQDNDYFLDKDLINYDLNTSFIKTKLSKRLMDNFLRFSGAKIFSKVKIHLNDKIYDSEFVDIYKLNYKIENINLNGLYPIKAKNLLLASLKDTYSLPADSDYCYYNYQFKPFDFSKKSHISITDFEKYVECPFKFFVKNYLNVDGFEDIYEAKLGSFLHSIMEEIFKEDFNFDVAFETKLNNANFSKREKIIINTTIKERFRIIVKDFYLTHKNAFINPQTKIIQEEKGNYRFDYGKGIINIVGKNDFAFIKDQKLTIIDYKSGNKEYDPSSIKYGLGLQLPLYTYFISEKEDVEPQGFFYSKILLDYIPKNNYFAKENYLTSFSLTGDFKTANAYENDFSSMIRGNNKGFAVKNDVENTLRIALKSAKKTLCSIHENNFEIKPIAKNQRTSCDCCPYRAICYRPSEFYGLQLVEEE